MPDKIDTLFSAFKGNYDMSDNLKPSESVFPDNEFSDYELNAPKKGPAPQRPARRVTGFRPIILTLAILLLSSRTFLNAQFTGNVKLGATYSDNVFQLSENDLGRFDDDSPSLDFVETSDDLSLSTRIELAYPIHYRWWKFTPSVIGRISQNISNTDKYRRDVTVKLRVDRYYWNFTGQYANNPYIYFRDFKDTDGTGINENYSYSRNVYRADLAIKPVKNNTLKANFRVEDYFYNEYFTEADGQALTGGLDIVHSFPAFTLEAGYDYRNFANENLVDEDDSSYESNRYKGKIVLPKMLLSEGGRTKWQPSLALAYEQRYYQGDGSWYGGRADLTYTLSTGFTVFFSPKLNLSLDYSHIFRNVLSDNQALLRAKEYGENRLGAELGYKF